MATTPTESPHDLFRSAPLPFRQPEAIFKDRVERAVVVACFSRPGKWSRRGITAGELRVKMDAPQQRIEKAAAELVAEQRLIEARDEYSPGPMRQTRPAVPAESFAWPYPEEQLECVAAFEALYASAAELWACWDDAWESHVWVLIGAGFHPHDLESIAAFLKSPNEFVRIIKLSVRMIDQLVLIINETRR